MNICLIGILCIFKKRIFSSTSNDEVSTVALKRLFIGILVASITGIVLPALWIAYCFKWSWYPTLFEALDFGEDKRNFLVIAILNTFSWGIGAAALYKLTSHSLVSKGSKEIKGSWMLVLGAILVAKVAGYFWAVAVGVDYANIVIAQNFKETTQVVRVEWLVLFVLFSPVVEEIFFRGLVFVSLRNALGIWQVLFIQAAMFASIHGSVIDFPPLFVFGCFMAYL